ncbi:hypothetical protein PIIN_00503 [Serendipita indica DSM 11827]|uniref:Xylosidase/arabinosidase n=1 Tax=Serendipita indica (strain DSM 11827) TaxID=1109443 RepID=G4U2T4_SERID|nr:hypothetical protein PIIN_00503 [Serendipita indica DSM 11827]
MESNKVIRRADPSTIQNKVLVGYQGWFTCAGDGPPVHQGHHGWLHWFDKPLNQGGRPNFDLFPDVSEYAPEELYPAPGLSYPPTHFKAGQTALLFSSRNQATVNRHFHWMARHAIDGVFLQRFATQCEVDGNVNSPTADLMRLRDEVLDRVRAAAEKENRVWAIMYDVTGVPADRIEHVLRVDWHHLLSDKRILDSPYYVREKGQPVVAVWGLGFEGARHTPQSAAAIARNFKSSIPGGAYVWAGVPSQWRTLSGDMDPNPGFIEVFKNEFDAISPWTVGRYHTIEAIDRFCEERTAGDFKELKDLPKKVDYFPTIWPGGSSHNLSEGRLGLNDAPRLGGKFLWRQLWNVKHLGARTIYVAMFDEYDEGTAILPSVPLKRSLPKCDDPNRQFPFIALDADGEDNLSPDWYLRVCGFAVEVMRDERRIHADFPKKQIDDYWATRPKYETLEAAYSSASGLSASTASIVAGGSGSSSSQAVPSNSSLTPASGSNVAPIVAEATQSGPKPPVRKDTGSWGVFGIDDTDGPPPYSLETDFPSSPVVTTASTAVNATTIAPNPIAGTQPAIGASPNLGTVASGSPLGANVHRASSYSAGSGNTSEGATGLGRSSTYSPSSAHSGASASGSTASTPNRPIFAPPTFAPPSSRPSSSASSPLRPPERPPVHPSSPLAGPSTGSVGSSTPPQTYSPYQRPGTLSSPPGTPSVGHPSSLPQQFATSMNISSPNPLPTTAPTAGTEPTTALYNPAFAPHVAPSTSQGPMIAPSSTGTGLGIHSADPANPMYAPGAVPSIGTPGGFVAPPVGQGPSPTWNASTSGDGGYFSGGFNAANPVPGSSNVAAGGSSPAPSHWASPSIPPPSNSVYPTAPQWNTPNTTPGFVTPSGSYAPPAQGPSHFAPPTAPPSAFAGVGVAGAGGQTWTSPYPSPGGGPSTPNAYSSPSVPPNLPPRPPGAPGQSGGFVAPPNTFLGGFMKQASGVVDKYAGESTRIQIEKGVMTAAQTGSKLLGKFTK